jgi:hypothetical protein
MYVVVCIHHYQSHKKKSGVSRQPIPKKQTT